MADKDGTVIAKLDDVVYGPTGKAETFDLVKQPDGKLGWKVGEKGVATADDLANAFINGWTKEKVLALPKGSRPNPTEYLKPEYIANHLKKFENGVTKFISDNPTGAIGPPNGTFVFSKSQANDLISQSKGDVTKLEDLLGLNRGTLGSNPKRIDVDSPLGLRIPNGNEDGANSYWIPGGKTSGGILEAIVDQIQPGKYIVKPIY